MRNTLALLVRSQRTGVMYLGVTYTDILPCLDLLDPICDIPESRPSILQELVDSLAHTLGVSPRSQKGNLIGQPSDVGGQGKQLVGETLGQTMEFGVIAILGIVGATESCRLRL